MAPAVGGRWRPRQGAPPLPRLAGGSPAATLIAGRAPLAPPETARSRNAVLTCHTLKPLIAALAAVAGVLAWPGPLQAPDKPVVLKLSASAPPKSPWAVQIERIVAKTTEESQGGIKIEAYLGGQLGNEQDTLQQVARGRIEMGYFRSAPSR